MKKYTSPFYESQAVEASDIILLSTGANVSVEQIGAETNASLPLNQLLGRR
ncbi:MAG: hypothetical protein IJX02_06000 [Clostridia bacterium]|nr:hypothetical protein [Clostridia bacterium]